MSFLNDGIYRIGYGRLTMGLNPKDERMILLSLDGESSQTWRVQNQANGNVTIQNVTRGTYLNYDGDPEDGNQLFASPDSREWELARSQGDVKVLVAVPREPGGMLVTVAGKQLLPLPLPMFLVDLMGDGADEKLTFESVE